MSNFLMFAVSVTWNGTTLTGPTLIYLDEILVDGTDTQNLTIGDPNRPGALVCRSETRPQAEWRDALGDAFQPIPFYTGDIQQIRNSENIPNLSRLSRRTEIIESFLNGLFTCRVNVVNDLEDTLANFVHVGIYIRGNPQGETQTP